MTNHTFMSTFLLLNFSSVRELQILYLIVFLVFYLTTLTGNLLIIGAVMTDPHLHTPMYFFLVNLAVMDIGTVTVIVPKSIINSLTRDSSISYFGCVAQIFFTIFFMASDLAILTAMSYDRYIAICNPLQYDGIMHKGACIQISVIAWIICLLYSSLQTGGTFAIPYCSNIINQFFCEIPALLKLSCSDELIAGVGIPAFACTVGLGCIIYIIITYKHIFSTVLKIPSTHGQKKALSTCFPHLAVISLLASTGLFAYAKSPSISSTNIDVVFAVIYTIIPPMLNPFIYSMRNKDVKNALWKLLDFEGFSKPLFYFGLGHT